MSDCEFLGRSFFVCLYFWYLVGCFMVLLKVVRGEF